MRDGRIKAFTTRAMEVLPKLAPGQLTNDLVSFAKSKEAYRVDRGFQKRKMRWYEWAWFRVKYYFKMRKLTNGDTKF